MSYTLHLDYLQYCLPNHYEQWVHRIRSESVLNQKRITTSSGYTNSKANQNRIRSESVPNQKRISTESFRAVDTLNYKRISTESLQDRGPRSDTSNFHLKYRTQKHRCNVGNRHELRRYRSSYVTDIQTDLQPILRANLHSDLHTDLPADLLDLRAVHW